MGYFTDAKQHCGQSVIAPSMNVYSANTPVSFGNTVRPPICNIRPVTSVVVVLYYDLRLYVMKM